MLIGHYGPAVWDTQRGHAKPIVRLWEAFLAVQAMDILAGTLGVLGLEGATLIEDKPAFNVPYSHSLISAVIIAVAAGLIYKAFHKELSLIHI